MNSEYFASAAMAFCILSNSFISFSFVREGNRPLSLLGSGAIPLHLLANISRELIVPHSLIHSAVINAERLIDVLEFMQVGHISVAEATGLGRLI